MERRAYIYVVTPLLVFLNCGELVVSRFGTGAALIVAGVSMLVVWGAVWARLCRLNMRPEFAVLSILPQFVFFISQYMQTTLFNETPFWGTLYALFWTGCLGVLITTALPDTRETTPWRDPVFLLLIPLTVLFTVSGFLQYYPYFSSVI